MASEAPYIFENIVKLVDSLVWPATLIFIIICFKSEISKLFNRLKGVKYKDFEADLTSIRQGTEELTKSIESKDASFKDLFTGAVSKLYDTANVLPEAAIVASWVELETATRELLRTYGYDDNNVQLSKCLRQVLNDTNSPMKAYDEYRELNKIKNTIIHDGKLNGISKDDARFFADVAIELATYIKSLHNKKIQEKSSTKKK